MNIDAVIWTSIGLLIGVNVGFVIAGVFGINEDEEEEEQK